MRIERDVVPSDMRAIRSMILCHHIRIHAMPLNEV